MIKKNFIDTIGNTPLIKLKYASEVTECNIYGKAEFLNPGGSIKDRAAKAIILDAPFQRCSMQSHKVVCTLSGRCPCAGNTKLLSHLYEKKSLRFAFYFIYILVFYDCN